MVVVLGPVRGTSADEFGVQLLGLKWATWIYVGSSPKQLNPRIAPRTRGMAEGKDKQYLEETFSIVI